MTRGGERPRPKLSGEGPGAGESEKETSSLLSLVAVGVRRALERVATELARPEVQQLPIVGCDGAPELGAAMVRDGLLTATVVQPRMSKNAVDAVAGILRGGPLPPPVSRLAGTPYPEGILFSGGGAGRQAATVG